MGSFPLLLLRPLSFFYIVYLFVYIASTDLGVVCVYVFACAQYLALISSQSIASPLPLLGMHESAHFYLVERPGWVHRSPFVCGVPGI